MIFLVLLARDMNRTDLTYFVLLESFIPRVDEISVIPDLFMCQVRCRHCVTGRMCLSTARNANPDQGVFSLLPAEGVPVGGLHSQKSKDFSNMHKIFSSSPSKADRKDQNIESPANGEVVV